MIRVVLGISLAVVVLGCSVGADPLEKMKVRVPGTTVEIELVKLPAGKVELPAQKPGEKPRVVEVKSIWVSTTEVTQDVLMVWDHQTGNLGLGYKPRRPDVKTDAVSGPSEPQWLQWQFPQSHWFDGNKPALSMGYVGAVHFCNWLYDQTDRKFRLPTEAEWEYACRAGGPPLGNLSKTELDRVAWYAGNSELAETLEPGLHAVAGKAPNAWGLYDMLGNMAEWVQQEAEEDMPYVKGGSWKNKAEDVNSTRRWYETKKWNDGNLAGRRIYMGNAPWAGFRVVCDDLVSARR